MRDIVPGKKKQKTTLPNSYKDLPLGSFNGEP